MVPPVDPYAASSYGSTFADAPGVLRENGWTQSYNVIMQGANGSNIGICSGSSPATNGSTLLPLLTEGQTMNIYGIQAVNAQVAKGFVFTLNVSGNGVGQSVLGEKLLMAGSATKNGPWFQHFELPIKIHGPAGVYLNAPSTTGTAAYNYVIVQYIIVDESRAMITA